MTDFGPKDKTPKLISFYHDMRYIMTSLKEMKQHLKNAEQAEKDLGELIQKRDTLAQRLEALHKRKEELTAAHAAAIDRYAEGKATEDDVQDASIKAGSVDDAISAMQASIAQIEQKIEQARRVVRRHEELAQEARRQYLFEQVDKVMSEAEQSLSREMMRLFCIVRASQHPMYVRSWIEGIVSRVEADYRNQNIPSLHELGIDVPPEIEHRIGHAA